MKLFKLFSLCFCAISFLMVSCTAELDSTSSSSSAIKAILQEFEDEDATRTYIGVDASDNLSYTWAVGDVLGIFPDQGTQVSFELSESSLSADGKSATFDGGAWSLKNGHAYYAYFPFSYGCFDKNVNKTNIPISYNGQKQVEFNNTTNAGQYDFNAAGASNSSNGGVSFNFKRLGALLRVKFALPATATYKTLVLSTDANVIPITGTVDITASTIAFAPATYSNSLTVDLNNVNGTVGQTAYVYMMLPPMTLNTLGKKLTATLKYDEKSTTYNLCTVGTTTINTPDFKANTRYKREAVYLSGDPVGTIDGGQDENEHTYVDLGLPSGTLWATTNIGATNPEDAGLYFAWGETTGYTSNTNDGRSFNYDSYKFMGGSADSYYTKYGTSEQGGFHGVIDNILELEAIDDAATANWGSSWRMPTYDEYFELLRGCYLEYTTNYKTTGKAGYIVYKTKNDNDKGLLHTSTMWKEISSTATSYSTSSKTSASTSYTTTDDHIFLPLAGYRNEGGFVNSSASYWTSTLCSSQSTCSYRLNFNKYNIDISEHDRYWGRSIRPVRNAKTNAHAYVDLGLSIKWATMNVGATEVAGTKINAHTGQLDCYGEYYAWGETSPKDSYTWANYTLCNGSSTTMKKYCTISNYGTVDNKTTLELADDAARANWGGTWRMPTYDEQTELYNNCYWEWTASYNNSGVAGYIVYKVKDDSDKGVKNNTGSSSQTPTASYSLSDIHIFLPAAGYRYTSYIGSTGSYGHYWPSSLYSNRSDVAYEWYFSTNAVNSRNDYRFYGQSVRAVCP